MSQKNYIDTDKLIEAIGQGRVKFFLEGQSVELELKVAIRKGENNDSNVYILGSFEGAGLDGLHTLKVKIGDDPGTTHDGSKIPPETPIAEPGDPGGQPGGSRKPQPPPPGGTDQGGSGNPPNPPKLPTQGTDQGGSGNPSKKP